MSLDLLRKGRLVGNVSGWRGLTGPRRGALRAHGCIRSRGPGRRRQHSSPCSSLLFWILGLSEGPVPRYRGLSGHNAALRTYSHDIYAFFGTKELATLSHALIGETGVRT